MNIKIVPEIGTTESVGEAGSCAVCGQAVVRGPGEPGFHLADGANETGEIMVCELCAEKHAPQLMEEYWRMP